VSCNDVTRKSGRCGAVIEMPSAMTGVHIGLFLVTPIDTARPRTVADLIDSSPSRATPTVHTTYGAVR
jgi:hypothetical protein